MFRCLAITDLCVGIISNPVFVAGVLSQINELQLRRSGRNVSIVFSGVSLLTATAISVDRHLTPSLGLRYRQAVTLRRVGAILSCFWLVCVAETLIYRFWSSTIAYGKHNWTRAPTHIGSTFLWSKCTCNASLYISCIIKHFSIRHCIFGKCSDPNRPSQGVFPSPASKAHVSLPRSHWSLCWSHFSSSVCRQVALPDKRTAKLVLLLSDVERYRGHSFQWSVFVDSNRNKCGQTTRSVAGPAIQTGCNTEASWCNFKLFLDCECGGISDLWLLGFHYFFKSDNSINHTVFNNFSLLLQEDLPSHPPSSSSNAIGPCSPRATERRRNSTEHSKIPKDCFCSTMGPNNISRLLSSASFTS